MKSNYNVWVGGRILNQNGPVSWPVARSIADTYNLNYAKVGGVYARAIRFTKSLSK